MFDWIRLLTQEYFYNVVPSMLFLLLLLLCAMSRYLLGFLMPEEREKFRIIPIIIYLAALLTLFTICRRTDIQGIRIIQYWIDLASRHDLVEMHLIGFVADVILFVPLGYMVREMKEESHWFWMPAVILLIGIVIEGLQFITKHGCIGVSDLVAYFTGGMVGICICAYYDWQYRKMIEEMSYDFPDEN